jgi:hypothetical protein
MNIHVYIRGQTEPLKFYDTDPKSRFAVHVGDGTLIVRQIDVDKPAEVAAVFAPGVWRAAYDVNHDPDA